MSKMFRTKKRFHWWYILIAIVLITAAVGVGCYIYVASHIQKNVAYVKTWSQVADATSKTVSQAQQGLSEIDAGNFPAGDSAGYPIIEVKQKDPNVENILVLGIDATEGGGTEGAYGANRGDSILVMSINKKLNTLKMASLLRDTKTYFPNTQSYHKLNAAFSYGGIGLQIDVINYAYKLDIQKYMLFDFSGFQNIIKTIGGVDISLTATEAKYVGVGITAGTYHLDSAHALLYARTRYIDTEFQRTQRQRNIIMAIFNKFKSTSVLSKVAVMNECLGFFKTNIPTTELAGNLMTFESGLGKIKQLSIPSEDDGMYTTETHPIWFWDLNWSAEVDRLQTYLYGN